MLHSARKFLAAVASPGPWPWMLGPDAPSWMASGAVSGIPQRFRASSTYGYCMLVELLNSGKKAQPSVEDALPMVFEQGEHAFWEFWTALAAAAPALIRKEVLTQENGGWSFRMPLLRRWIEARIGDDGGLI